MSDAPDWYKPASQVLQEQQNAARQAAMRRIERQHKAALAELVSRYPQTERDGWHELVDDAKAGSGSCIEAYSGELGVSVEDAISRVLGAREAFRVAWAEATARATAQRDALDAATTIEAVHAVAADPPG